MLTHAGQMHKGHICCSGEDHSRKSKHIHERLPLAAIKVRVSVANYVQAIHVDIFIQDISDKGYITNRIKITGIIWQSD